MILLRSILSVLAGYLLFAGSTFAIFLLTGQAPHAPASASFTVLSIAAGIIFAAAGGWVAAWLAGRSELAHGVAVAGVLALGAAVSLATTVGHGAVWSQVAAIVLMAPAAAFGGLLRARSVARGASAA